MYTNPPNSNNADIETARTFYDSGDFASAIHLLNDVIGNSFTSSAAWHLRGDCYFWSNLRVLACRDYIISLCLNPASAAEWRCLGFSYLDRNEPLKALYAFRNAIQISPGSVDLASCIAMALRLSGKTQGAISQYKALMLQEPQNPKWAIELGDIYLSDSLCHAAIEYYDIAIALACQDKQSVQFKRRALIQRSAAHEQLGMYGKALCDYDAILSVEPDDHDALLLRANARSVAGDFSSAKHDCCRLVEKSPGNAQAWELLGYVQMQLAEYGSAISSLSRSLLIEQNWSCALFRAVSYMRIGDNARAAMDVLLTTRLAPAELDVESMLSSWGLERFHGGGGGTPAS